MSIRQGKKLIASSTTNGFSLFDCKWADHILNNISWLRADTFSWQSGDVYVAAYEHLSGEFKTEQKKYYAWVSLEMSIGVFYTEREMPLAGDNVYYSGSEDEWVDYGALVSDYDGGGNFYLSNRTLEDMERAEEYDIVRTTGILSDTIGNITISYCLAEDGHKICFPDQESNISALYEKTGAADYYILDTTNKRFKLPRKQKRTLIQAVKNENGTWYNLYSDGWIEQGGTAASGSASVTFPVEFADTEYYFNANLASGGSGSTLHIISSGYNTTGCTLKEGQYQTAQRALTANAKWIASGYAAESAYASAGMRLEYYYVGNYVENETTIDVGKLTEIVNDFDIDTFKPEVDEAKNSAIVDISDAKTDAIDNITNLATDLGTSLKYGNVGDIFYTSRLDVSLNGAVECNGNLYNTTDFSGTQSIGNLLRDSKVPYISLSEHQTTVDTYGSCRCFGWDGGTEFRVPKLTDVFIEAGIAASEGEFITAGLPNITGGTGGCVSNATPYGVFALGGQYGTAGGGAGKFYQNTFDASRSSSVYGNSTTVQPPAVRYRAMVQLAFGATDDSVVTAGEVVADVSELNSHRVIAFQAPTSANSYTWYRKYADGWVEQGGFVNNTAAIKTISLLIPMANTDYQIQCTSSYATGDATLYQPHVDSKTTTSFKSASYGERGSAINTNGAAVFWEVKGMSAN